MLFSPSHNLEGFSCIIYSTVELIISNIVSINDDTPMKKACRGQISGERIVQYIGLPTPIQLPAT